MRGLTDRQFQVLELLDVGIRENGFAPSYLEMLPQLGIVSSQALFEHMRALERKGMILPVNGKKRAVTLTELGKITLGHRSIQVDRRFGLLLPRRCRDCARVTFAYGSCPCGCRSFAVEAA